MSFHFDKGHDNWHMAVGPVTNYRPARYWNTMSSFLDGTIHVLTFSLMWHTYRLGNEMPQVSFNYCLKLYNNFIMLCKKVEPQPGSHRLVSKILLGRWIAGYVSTNQETKTVCTYHFMFCYTDLVTRKGSNSLSIIYCLKLYYNFIRVCSVTIIK